MTTLAVPPFVPMPIQKLFVYPRLHLVFFFGRVARSVASIIPAIRIYGRNKRDRLPIRRPQLVVRSGRNRSQPRRLAAVQRDPINLRRPRPPRNERQLLPIRRPSRPRVAPPARQLSRLATAASRHHPNVAHRAIRLQIRRRHAISDPIPIRRNLRLANPMQRNQILKCNRALLCRLPRSNPSSHRSRPDNSRPTPHTSSPLKMPPFCRQSHQNV